MRGISVTMATCHQNKLKTRILSKMTLFFDTKVLLDSEAVSTISVWHSVESVFAVASYSQNRGGSVTIFDEQVKVTAQIHPLQFPL